MENTTFYDEIKNKWIESGGDINEVDWQEGDDRMDEVGCKFIITNEMRLIKSDMQIMPCLFASCFSKFSCNKFIIETNPKPNTLFKSCKDCPVYGNSYGYCKTEHCSQFCSNPLNISSYGDWSIKISKMMSSDILQCVVDYIYFEFQNGDGDVDYYFQYGMHFKTFDNIRDWNTLLCKRICCLTLLKTIDYKDFGGTDDPIMKCFCICGDGNGDCFFVQQNDSVFIIDYETS